MVMKANEESKPQNQSNDSPKDQNPKQIDGSMLISMLRGAQWYLKESESHINSLNVFPVPDGDTGTNMYHTFKEAMNNLDGKSLSKVNQITSQIARGALMGARGNSGVILSQLLRGFSEANKENEILDVEQLAKSFRRAASVAYNGVMKPVEGTILTVASKAAEGAELSSENNLDIVNTLQNTLEFAKQALEKTPEQLPALKEAGVVDAGGKGYVIILEGMLRGLQDKDDIEFDEEILQKEVKPEKEKPEKEEELTYMYDTQLLIDIEDSSNNVLEKIREELNNYGDSLIVVGSESTVKVHVHTNHPGIVLEYALQQGSIKDIVVENMQLQADKKTEPNIKATEVSDIQKNKDKVKEIKPRGIIAVAQGEGFSTILQELGVDKIISGGNTNNPSTNDFVKAIKEIKAREIMLLPNNKNIVSSAEQAASLVDKKTAVLSTTSIPEAIASLMVFDEDIDLFELKDKMEKEIEDLKTIQITEAVKESKINGFEIKPGDIIGVYNDDILCCGENYVDVILEIFEKKYEGEELVTIYFGENTDREHALNIKESLKEYSVPEIEVYKGGQPIYSYIISLE